MVRATFRPVLAWRDRSLVKVNNVRHVSAPSCLEPLEARQLLSALAGDANGDGRVSLGDVGIIGGNYGIMVGMRWEDGDFNGDGAVTFGDLVLAARNYGTVDWVRVNAPFNILDSAPSIANLGQWFSSYKNVVVWGEVGSGGRALYLAAMGGDVDLVRNVYDPWRLFVAAFDMSFNTGAPAVPGAVQFGVEPADVYYFRLRDGADVPLVQVAVTITTVSPGPRLCSVTLTTNLDPRRDHYRGYLLHGGTRERHPPSNGASG